MASNSWHLIGDAEELKSKPCRKIFMKDGPLLALFYAATDKFFLTNSRCPHAGGPLDQGDIEEVDGVFKITCPLHYYQFDLATGKSPTGLNVKTFEVKLEDGKVFGFTPGSLSLTKQ